MSDNIIQFVGSENGQESPPDRLIQEKQLLTFRPLLAAGLLLAARKAGIITWTKGQRGTAWYRLSDVDAYLKAARENQCHAPDKKPSSNSADNGLAPKVESPGSIASGMTPGQSRRASLGTADLEEAKTRLAEIIVRGETKTAASHLSIVLEDYRSFRARRRAAA